MSEIELGDFQQLVQASLDNCYKAGLLRAAAMAEEEAETYDRLALQAVVCNDLDDNVQHKLFASEYRQFAARLRAEAGEG